MNEYIDINGLWPAFSSLWPFPGWEHITGEYLSAFFILLTIGIGVGFIIPVVLSYLRINKKVKYLGSLLLLSPSTSQQLSSDKNKRLIDDLWGDFKRTLIEVRTTDAQKNEKISLYNTIDSNYFFNTSTLAAELTESRLLAAVPGFLTGIGVLGTFIGLQLGLSELNIGNDVAVEDMKAGLAQVISGAEIAFLTSVWGVGLSLIFNFLEKIFERSVRNKINKIQSNIDSKYPRFIPESQLQQIAKDSSEIKDSLQGLGESLGKSLGEEIGSQFKSAITDLGSQIISPIESLAGKTENANNNVLDSLINRFLTQFEAAGSGQAEEMKKATEKFTTALDSLDSSITLLLKQLEENQGKSAEREKELIENMSSKIDDLVKKSNEQYKVLAGFVGKTLSDIGSGEEARNESTNNLLQRLEETLQNQLDASEELIKQGENLQQSINASIQGSVTVSASMKETASELNQASQHMKGTGYSIEKAGATLSGSINQAVQSTTELTKENKLVMTSLNTQQQILHEQQHRMNQTVIEMNNLFSRAASSFQIMDEQQRKFLEGLAKHVNDLSIAISKNFKDYTEGLNTATEKQLITWVKNTTDYTTAMAGAINALKNVVDEIDVKLSTGR